MVANWVELGSRSKAGVVSLMKLSECLTSSKWLQRTCNVLQGAAGVSDTMLVVLVRPACTGRRRGPAPGGTDHPPGGMTVRRYGCQVVYAQYQVVATTIQVVWPLGRTDREPSCIAARSRSCNERIYTISPYQIYYVHSTALINKYTHRQIPVLIEVSLNL